MKPFAYLTVTDEKRVRFFYDDLHETHGSYCYETEEATKAAEDHEIDMLQRGEWIVFGMQLQEQCPTCHEWHEVDSVWGCVYPNKSEEIRKAALDQLGVSNPDPTAFERTYQ